ncbi:MAG: DNA methyltransferase, partial [Thermacetogeniaceae bacterium]
GLDDWWVGREVQKILSPTAYENLKFNTQKPEGLLKRIIRGHSCPGDLVADFFCGTGTTGAVAEKLGRRWIMADASRLALIIAYKRLLQQGCKPFIQQSIAGKITQGENKSRDAICQLVLKQLLVQNCSAEWEEILLELGGLAYSTFDHLPLRGEIKEKIRELASCDPLALLEYWSVDPDYDGRTFCSRWQCCRARDGRVDNRARIVVPKVKGSRRICVKAVDVFGNESVVCETVNR